MFHGCRHRRPARQPGSEWSLVALPAFKAVVGHRKVSQLGSIPRRFRHSSPATSYLSGRCGPIVGHPLPIPSVIP